MALDSVSEPCYRAAAMGLPGRNALRRVLLVDDDEAWLRSVRTLAERFQWFDVHTESVVSRALEFIREVRPSVVITAMCLAGTDDAGLFIVRTAREARVPVAVVCSLVGEATRSKLRGVHVFDKSRFVRADVPNLLDHLSRFQTEWGSVVERFSVIESSVASAEA